MKRTFTSALLLTLITFCALTLRADDGSGLWLDYRPVADAALNQLYAGRLSSVYYQNPTPVIRAAEEELALAASRMLGITPGKAPSQRDAGIVLGFGRDRAVSTLKAGRELTGIGDGYIIRTAGESIYILGATDRGVLYGTFHLIRLMQAGEDISALDIIERPAFDVRILNHWDNLDRSVERGYAGASIWEWDELPAVVSPRYREYARANASVGINATVLNNVNANATFITSEYLEKVKTIADVFRPYGIRVFLSINFNSPVSIGGLENSDPLDGEVQNWWKAKAAEIYRAIPDFGGFLVKANSEGQPGPQDYGRTHVDGANMLAAALKPHGGIVMWRSFVYTVDATDPMYDRAKQAYLEFMPLDGQFADNVIIQVKNGPIDFQPREPVTSLFGAMRQTPLMVEFQITQEYLGHSTQLVYLDPMWKETLHQDTYCKGPGSTVAKVTDGTIYPAPVTAIAGVSNVGMDANWTGHVFAQANWYAFGRTAWNPDLESERIADEWLRMTFGSDPGFVEPVKWMMMASHEAAVDYMQPLGLHHIFAEGHHYGPGVWERLRPGGNRPDWVPEYYHRADAKGVGFDRTTSGTDYVSEYFPPLSEIYNDINRCPENLILFFHHVPWGHRMKDGRTLWEELCYKYTDGLDLVREFQKIWDSKEGMVDAERFKHVQYKLREQVRDAIWWRDGVLLYFQSLNGLPIPYELERPMNRLETLMNYRLRQGISSLPPGGEPQPSHRSPMYPGSQPPTVN